VGYLGVFGLGTIAGMNRTLRIASGTASIAFGLLLVHRIGFVDGLFTAAPTWVAH
jgi:hypothetical protein